MKDLFLTLVFIASSLMLCHSQNCFELIVEPEITNTSGNGSLLTCEFKVSIVNASVTSGIVIYTMQNAFGISDSVTSFTTFDSISSAMNGGQAVIDEFPLVPAVNYLGQDFNKYILFGQTVENMGNSLPLNVNQGDTVELVTLQLNFDGTQKFTDIASQATASMPYIFDDKYISFFPGDDIIFIPSVLNSYGSALPNGFPVTLNCYTTTEGPCSNDLILDSSLGTVSGLFEAQNSIIVNGPLAVEAGETLMLHAPNIIIKDQMDASLGAIEVDKNGCQ
ncbi:MAG: hypothetical protein AAGK97_08065 [Bacteroidota bacterium]